MITYRNIMNIINNTLFFTIVSVVYLPVKYYFIKMILKYEDIFSYNYRLKILIIKIKNIFNKIN